MRAVFSDIHGNLPALDECLKDMGLCNVTDYTCLGDIVGYGASPIECLERIMALSNCETVLGNHDDASIFDPEGFNENAEKAIFWTRDKIENAPNVRELMIFLCEMQRIIVRGETTFCHGSPRDPTNEYVFANDAWNYRKMNHIFDTFDGICFCGHTHTPGYFIPDISGYIFYPQSDFGTRVIDLREYQKILINVGSIGQPRDNSSDSRYVLFDEDARTIQFREVCYDIEAARRAIYAEDGLPDAAADRLGPN